MLNLKGQFINEDLLITAAVYELIHICSDLLLVVALASEDAVARGSYTMWAQKLLLTHPALQVAGRHLQSWLLQSQFCHYLW